ncbi:MAG: GNAT family N-acetyltransferase [Bacteroidetes bacterium]|nr:GNAT family N-acetyltransferase [Bacteroidota bacterium]
MSQPTLIPHDLILENQTVLLRPLELSDFDHLLYFSRNEPELWTYSLEPATGEENLDKYIRKALDARAAGREFPFVVLDKLTNQYAGSTRFYDIQPDFKTLQLGYTWYGKDFQGTSLNKNCKLLLLTYAFETLGMHRVEFRADNNNERSKAAMRSIGCQVDGVLRSNMPTYQSDRRRDSIVLSILRDEWFGGVKSALELKIKNR